MVFGPMRRHRGPGTVGGMDFMQQAPAIALAVLALIDATSIGTLIIPIWLLLRRDYRSVVPKVLLYLAVLAGFYWMIGVLLRTGWQLGELNGAGALLDAPPVRWAQLLLGAGLLTWALTRPGKGQADAGAARDGAPRHSPDADRSPGSTRYGAHPAATMEGTTLVLPARLGKRLHAALDSTLGVVVLALLAGLMELPTMLPYLGALGLMESLGWHHMVQMAVLVGYCALMTLPALLLVLLRLTAGARVDRWLQRVGAKAGAFAAESLAWVAGFAGFLLIRSASNELGILTFLG